MITDDIVTMLTSMKDDIDRRDFKPICGSFVSKKDTLKLAIDKTKKDWLAINDTEYLYEMRSAAIAAVKELIVGLYKTRAEAQLPRIPVQCS